MSVMSMSAMVSAVEMLEMCGNDATSEDHDAARIGCDWCATAVVTGVVGTCVCISMSLTLVCVVSLMSKE